MPTSGGAPLFPVMNFGTGSHVDSVVMKEHTHSYDEGEVGSHMAIRQIAMGSLAAIENDDFGNTKVAKDPTAVSYLA